MKLKKYFTNKSKRFYTGMYIALGIWCAIALWMVITSVRSIPNYVYVPM